MTGGRAFKLAMLRRKGLPIPAGFIIPSDCVAAWQREVHGRPPQIAEGDRATLLDAFNELGGGPVTVRSSVVDEDSANARSRRYFELRTWSGEYLSQIASLSMPRY